MGEKRGPPSILAPIAAEASTQRMRCTIDLFRVFELELIGLNGLGRIAQTVHSNAFALNASLISVIGSMEGSNIGTSTPSKPISLIAGKSLRCD
jgi:hypothetical protein